MQRVGLVGSGPAQTFRSLHGQLRRQRHGSIVRQATQQGSTNLKRLKKAELQEQLNALGLSTEGKRDELLDRLESHLSHLSHLETLALDQPPQELEEQEDTSDAKADAVQDEPESALTLESLLSQTKAQLAGELSSRGLPKTGLKADLAQRLLDAIQMEGGSNDVMDLPVEPDESAPGPDPIEADALTAPGSMEPEQATSILDPPQSAEPDVDTSPQIDPVPDYNAPDEDLATEGDNPPDSLLDEPVPREQQPGILRDAEGTVIRANFGSGASTEDRFENAGTRAADLAESEMSPEALEGDAQDGTNKAFQEVQAEENMDDAADTFVSEERAGVGFDSPGDTGYTETISSSGTPIIDTMQDSAAAELGMPGEDESADRPEDDAVAGAPETLEELDAQLDEQEADINATQGGGISDVTYPEEEARAASEARIAEQHARAQAVLAEADGDPSPEPPLPAGDSAASDLPPNDEGPADEALPTGNGASSNSSHGFVDDTHSTALPYTDNDDSSGAQPDGLGSMPSSAASDKLVVDEAPSASERLQNEANVPSGSYSPAMAQNAAQTVAPEPGAFSDMTATPGVAAPYLEIDAPSTSPMEAAPNSSDLAQAALAGMAARAEGSTASAESISMTSVAQRDAEHDGSSPESSLADIANGHSAPASTDPEDHPWNDDPHQADSQPAANLGTAEPQTEDPELEAASERHATPIRAGQGSESDTADAAGPSPAELSQAAIAGRSARSDSTPAALDSSEMAPTGAFDSQMGPSAEQTSMPESVASQSMAGKHAASSSRFQTEDAELESGQQEAQTPQARGADSQEWAAAGTASPSPTSEMEPAEAHGNGKSSSEALDASAAATLPPPEISSPAESPVVPEANGATTASLAADAEDQDELQDMQSKVESRNKDVKQLQEQLAVSHQEAADYTASIENMQAEMAQLRAEHVALSKQLEQAPQPHGSVSPHIKEELSKQLTALSSQVVHLQSEIMRRGQLSGQLHQQLQADLPSSYINGHVSQPDPMQSISLRTSSTQPRISQEDVSPADASGASPQSSPSGQDQASESPVEEDDQARQPGIVVAAGAMEFMRVGSKVSEAMGSVFNIFKQGMKGRKNSN